MLKVELEALQEQAYDLSMTGFDENELAELFRADDVKDDDCDIDEELKKPVYVKKGDVWNLGKHRLVIGDSTDEATMDILMDGQKANLVVTDPPYNVAYKGTAGKIQNDNM